MFNKQSPRPAVKDINEFVNHKSHVQKKYFSLMLVPSFSSGKTRSVRIPYGIFHFIVISAMIITTTVCIFYLRADHYEKAAQQAGASLNEAQQAYTDLQNNLKDEQSRLQDGQNQLKEQLTEAEISRQTEISRQSQNYQENLNGLQDKIEDIERQLQELDDYRQDAFDKLEVKAYIPPVKDLLDEVTLGKAVSLANVQNASISSDERSGAVSASEGDLRDYFTIFALKREALEENYARLKAAIDEAAPYIRNYPTKKPVGGSISSNFGYRTDPMGGRNREYHDAVDIRCPSGTDVIATGGGTVQTARWSGSYGYFVVIDHGFGIQSAYAHNSKLLVEAGDTVERGDAIALSGSTGNSTGPHVHYEVRLNGITTNPVNYFLE